MEERKIIELHIEAGDCKVNGLRPESTEETDALSQADVLIYAVSDPNTKAKERTNCTFQCKEGYFDVTIGYEIPFKCEPNASRTEPLGNKTAPTQCDGVCLICVLAFSIALIVFGPGGSVGILSPITPQLFFHFTIF